MLAVTTYLRSPDFTVCDKKFLQEDRNFKANKIAGFQCKVFMKLATFLIDINLLINS